MRALTYDGAHGVEIVEMPEPVPGPRDAIVRTTVSSVCTSDVHVVDGAREIPRGRVIGHESVGVVVAVGAEVSRVSVGQRVVCGAITPCGRCDFCQRGQASQCGGDASTTRFVTRRHGTLSDRFLALDADLNLAVIPDGVADDVAVYVADMLPTGMAGASAAQVAPGGTVVVLGQGPVGLCATASLRALGAGLVVAVEPEPARRDLARVFGADTVLDPEVGDVADQVRELVGGGADAAVDAAGFPGSMALALRALRRGGTLSSIAFHTGASTVELPWDALVFGLGNHTIRTTLTPGGSEYLQRLLRLVAAGRVDLSPLTTHRFAFDEAPDAFTLMRAKSDGVIKVLVEHPSA